MARPRTRGAGVRRSGCGGEEGGAGMGRELSADGRFAITVGGTRYLLPAHCPHRGGYLRCGYVNERGARITCPLHGATFALETGRRLAGPACPDLDVVKEEGS